MEIVPYPVYKIGVDLSGLFNGKEPLEKNIPIHPVGEKSSVEIESYEFQNAITQTGVGYGSEIGWYRG